MRSAIHDIFFDQQIHSSRYEVSHTTQELLIDCDTVVDWFAQFSTSFFVSLSMFNATINSESRYFEGMDNMKKLIAIVAVASALSTPVLAQSPYNNDIGNGMAKPHIHIVEASDNQMLGPIYTPRGKMTDPDPNVRLDLRRNFDHYFSGTGG